MTTTMQKIFLDHAYTQNTGADVSNPFAQLNITPYTGSDSICKKLVYEADWYRSPSMAESAGANLSSFNQVLMAQQNLAGVQRNDARETAQEWGIPSPLAPVPETTTLALDQPVAEETPTGEDANVISNEVAVANNALTPGLNTNA